MSQVNTVQNVSANNNEDNTKKQLFREEVIDFVNNKQFGEVVLHQPKIDTIITLICFAFGLSVIFFIFFFSTSRKAQVVGVLLPTDGVVRVITTQSGIVLKKLVADGQLVRKGEVLFVLSNEKNSSTLKNVQNRISQLMQGRKESFDSNSNQVIELSKRKIAASQSRRLMIAQEIQTLEEQIRLQSKNVEISLENLDRSVDLQEKHYISAAQVREKQSESFGQKQRLLELRRMHGNLKRELLAIETEIVDISIQSKIDTESIRRNLLSLEQEFAENEIKREFSIVASEDGVVTALIADVGQNIELNQPVATILPSSGKLGAEIYVPSRSMGFLKPGLKVWLRYQAYPYQKFGQYSAKVAEISSMSLRPEDINKQWYLGIANSEPVYRIRLNLEHESVETYGAKVSLRSGMTFDASIQLDRRYLYEWILEPIYSLSGRV